MEQCAIFLPFDGNLALLRKNTLRALAMGKQVECFTVCMEDVYYFAGGLEEDLKQADDLRKAYGKACSVRATERLRCAALWNAGRGSGVLIGWRSRQLFAAVLPLISTEQAHGMQEICRELSLLAERAEKLKIHLADGRELSPVLQKIIEEMGN